MLERFNILPILAEAGAKSGSGFQGDNPFIEKGFDEPVPVLGLLVGLVGLWFFTMGAKMVLRVIGKVLGFMVKPSFFADALENLLIVIGPVILILGYFLICLGMFMGGLKTLPMAMAKFGGAVLSIFEFQGPPIVVIITWLVLSVFIIIIFRCLIWGRAWNEENYREINGIPFDEPLRRL